MDMVELGEHSINAIFKDITTIDDVEENISMLGSLIKFPTACYFNIDREHNIFYNDQQGCLLWAYDPL